MNLSRFEYIIEILDELRSLSREMPVIVEGRKDEQALREIGLKGDIQRVQTSSSVVEFSDSIATAHREVVLFTDLDAAGKKIGRSVKKYLTDKGVKVNDNIAKKFMYALETVEAENVAKRLRKACIKFRYP